MKNKKKKLNKRALNFFECIDKLRVFSFSKINPDWLDIPTYLIRRESQLADSEIVEDCGKGPTDAQARRSALYESAERYSEEMFKGKKLTKGTLNELKEEHNIMPLTNLLRENTRQNIESMVLTWAEGYDLLNNEKILVPKDCVNFPYRSTFYSSNTSGLAAGKTYEEAYLHAIYEVIERDTLSIYVNNSIPGKDIILKTTNNDQLSNVYSKLVAADIKMSIKFLPNDTHIPVVLVLFEYIPKMPGIKAAGAGCHLDPYVATIRALTEAAQSTTLGYLKLQNEQCKGEDITFSQLGNMKIERPSLQFKSLYTATKTSVLKVEDIYSKSEANVIRDTKKILKKLEKFTSHVIAVDIRDDDLGIPAVKIVTSNFENTIADGIVRRRSRIVGKALQTYFTSTKAFST